MIWIVGSGICRGHVTENVREIVSKAEVIYGSRRALKLLGVENDSRARVIVKFGGSEIEKIILEGKDKNVVVVSTGDPMVAGLGKFFREGFVEPGISSVQVALARLKVDLTEVVVVDCHAKEFDPECLNFLNRRHLLILADRKFEVSKLGKRRVKILENLCSENEEMREGLAEELKVNSDYALVFVERE